jgi:hypothetical protein
VESVIDQPGSPTISSGDRGQGQNRTADSVIRLTTGPDRCDRELTVVWERLLEWLCSMCDRRFTAMACPGTVRSRTFAMSARTSPVLGQHETNAVCPGRPDAQGPEYKVARGRIELPTYRFSGGRSYQLSYLAVHSRGLTSVGKSTGGPAANSRDVLAR